MFSQLRIMRIFVWLAISTAAVSNAICPEKCSCKKISSSSGVNTNYVKVKCGETPQSKIASFKEIDFGEDVENVVQLDLSENQISYIDRNDFTNYTNLKRLDLSFNSLKQIDESMFGEIPSLERLKLSTNVIAHIFQGSFENLKSLKQLDISGNPLACDCDLLWLSAWTNSMSVKLQPPPKCETPIPFKGMLLKRLKVGSDLHCESPSQPLLELKPNNDQLAFEGDELILRCRAPRVAVGAPRDSEDLPARAHVFWGWSEKIVEPNSTDDVVYRDPQIFFPSIQVDAKHLSDSGLLDSILRIPFVTKNHSGMWDCRLRSQQANLSRSISVLVISDSTKYCSAYELRNNKGQYFWPRTIREKTVRLPCVSEAPVNAYATCHCNENGEWVELNTDSCLFISETTRILEQFAKMNLSIAKGSVLESAKRLRNYTQSNDNLKNMRDPIDFVYVTKTLRNYLGFVSQEKDLGTMLLDIVSQIIILPSILGQQAQIIDTSGSKLINAVEFAGQHTPLALTHKPHLAIEYFKIRSESFTGMTCTWLRSDLDLEKRIFQCNTANQIIDIFRHQIDASIQIPANFLEFDLSQQFMSHKLMVAVYENSNFLPYHRNQTNFQVTSAVIGVKLMTDDLEMSNLTEPISIMLRVRPYHHDISAPVPVWWDPETNSWMKNACQTSYYFHGLLVFSCNKLGYYGLLQNRKYLNDFADENAGARFRLSPVGFYVGCSLLFICSWINIVTYITSKSAIQMARRQRHALVNTWLALSALCFVFGVGIFQTEDFKICQSFGIAIHYLSLCVILWVCVSVSNMYKRLSKRNRIPIDDLPKEDVGRKPILGIYLVGWGIGMIICGISAAVNMREYASYSHCFLKNGPALSAIFVPATILLFFLTILFICVRCSIRVAHDHMGHFSEGTQGTENVDLELLESTNNGMHLNQSERYRSLTLSSPTTSMQDDLEHTHGAQLNAHFVFLLMYIVSWLSAAASVITPFEDKIMYEEETFSIVFAITSSILGVFILFFYSISRSDVRSQWHMLSCRNFCSCNCCRTRSVSDTKEINTTVTYQQTCGTVNSGSRSNSQCSKNRPPSARSNHLKHLELNSAGTLTRNGSPSKLQGVAGASNISHLNRQQFVHNPVILTQEIPNADIFYNPNQINVARKFFKKQKRLAKRNNFELQRHMGRVDYGDGMSDVSSTVGVAAYPRPRQLSIFSTGSKVNNTNIHVRAGDGIGFTKEARQQTHNPNILSDSCNESDMIVDAERLVLGAESLRALSNRNKVTNIEMVANIYTNVPETSQPQHEIVTMRADDKFRKSMNVENFLEQDEIDMERNNLNSQNERTSTPLYVNGNIRNIVGEHIEPVETSTADTSAENNGAAFELNSSDGTDQLILSLNSPMAAMNTIGLPETKDQPKTEESPTSSSEEIALDLGRNEAYVSEALQITDRIYQNDHDGAIRIQNSQQNKSKSLISLDLEMGPCRGSKRKADEFHETQVRSISCSNLSHAGDELLGAIANPLPAKPAQNCKSSSPVLFSPSMCEINDELELPSPSDRRKPMVLAEESTIIDDEMSAGSFEAVTNNSDSLNLFAQSLRRNFSSSPTCESDLNYQNSELSIRSHGVYAPQPDNDLNLTLTGGDIYYPYQSSEVSDVDDDNDFEDFNNCSNDCLLPQDMEEHDPSGSHTSLDELYQRITRRSPCVMSGIPTEFPDNPEVQAEPIYEESPQRYRVEGRGSCTTDQIAGVQIDGDIPNETFEDDSSQSSIISYISGKQRSLTKK